MLIADQVAAAPCTDCPRMMSDSWGKNLLSGLDA
jgi:hypothetical protein